MMYDEFMASGLHGQRGRIVGDHPWTGHTGEIVRCVRTPIGWMLVVKMDTGDEAGLFEPKQWLKTVELPKRKRGAKR